MSRIAVLAGKEFRSYFNSWLAYIFIGLFVVTSLITFFFVGEFFGAGRAEITPFFEWLPLTLVVLIPGLTMRQWAREREMGSIELLMTLPAHSSELVLGKFAGTLGLVVVSLVFTLGIPVTADMLGDLDWGPVVGGYVAALLLGGAYVAIGLFVSSWFTDQFLALICAGIVCGVFGFMSWPTVLEWVSGWPEAFAETFSFLGFWGRFEAIQRGVLDFRDIAYYLTITALFLFLNVCQLRFRRWA